MNKWQRELNRQHEAIRNAGLWRRRRCVESVQQPFLESDECWLTSFASNDYLGLAAHPKLAEISARASYKWGVGAGASHLVSGHQSVHHQLEEKLAEFVGSERALLFANGFMANLALNNAFLGDGDLVLHDRLNHASLIDGGRACGATFKRYAHNDISHAIKLILANAHHRLAIMSDGVFSMDGDVADLPQLHQLSDQHQGLLCVDDAHGFGVMGRGGRGTLSHFELGPTGHTLMMGTLGKALGCYGAFVAGDAIFIEHLIQRARSYAYTTALPPGLAATAIGALDILGVEYSALSDTLGDLVRRFKSNCKAQGLQLLPSDTPIQAVMVGAELLAVRVSERLKGMGFLVPAIRTPTVPKSQARLRVVLTASHTCYQVDALVDALAAAFKAEQDLQISA